MKNNNKGFTLLELAIVMAVIGFITIGFTGISASMLNLSKQNDTKDKLRAIKIAIDNYVVKYGRLPCPAGMKLSPKNDNYGKEKCIIDTANGIKLANNIMVGTMPISELNLEVKYSYDGWDNKFIYFVVSDYVNDKDNLYTKVEEDIHLINNKHAYAIVSAGKNQHLAYSYKSITKQNGTKVDIVGKKNSYDETSGDIVVDFDEDKDFDDIVVLNSRGNMLQNIEKFDQICPVDVYELKSSSNDCSTGFSFDSVTTLKYREKLYNTNVVTITEEIDTGEGTKTLTKLRRCIIECAGYGRAIIYSQIMDL
ncbi:MAG: type II secretion system GspH family protein [Rickettsiales bacterium]|jgi:prepilin-type N-terminal cleavage/methylation domain-containing protein|nr:type II secretion system GspH family protein [Rickettsiales bacterium]